tara:strand:- start:147 stop:407 length:261 start_codon:yes stop_codon:yes gene_type:complete
MTDELVNTLYKLYDRLATIKCTNDHIIVQYGNETVPMKRNVFSRLVDNEKLRDLLKQYETLNDDEYIIAAYYEGDIVGCKTRIRHV